MIDKGVENSESKMVPVLDYGDGESSYDGHWYILVDDLIIDEKLSFYDEWQRPLIALIDTGSNFITLP